MLPVLRLPTAHALWACGLIIALAFFSSLKAQESPTPIHPQANSVQANSVQANSAQAITINSSLGPDLMRMIRAHEGDVAVAMRHLATGESFEHRAKEPQGTASLIKLPIMIEAYRQADVGKLSLDKMIELKAEDQVQGSGVLTTHFSPGTRISVRDAIRLMIAFSDNTATNLVLDQISIPATCDTMRQWGYPETRINAKVFRRDLSIDLARSQRFGLGSTTASDMVDLLAKLHAGQLVSPTACKDMMAHLAACDDKIKFPALLPPGTKIAHKTGSVAKIRTDAGIIETPSGPVALCVLTENNRDTRWTDDNAGDRLCAAVAKATYNYFEAKSATPKRNGAAKANELAIGAVGDLVEALQRTLNSRAVPSPRLSVDGDFGTGTQTAVKAFQTSKQLAATGIVDQKTWDALGPLMLEEVPVADPDAINSEKLPIRSADDPWGPPAVTCKAWTIADASTGKILWNEKGDEPLDFASTTKIMTAYLVMQYCSKHPEALDEILVFSERADKTNGSTAGVRTGERVRVRDLLYGLLLPSGNDASVAFAEHFGDRLTPDATDGQRDQAMTAYDRFIAAMNHQAAELEMSQTLFVNPHGLTAEGHHSSCNDLVRLTMAARTLELFRIVTSTRQYGCRVTGEGGYQRNIRWENTNQLLPIEGYSGVKTGTTDAAGACLVSSATRGDRELITVVLGSAASAARYSDSRNLYAWAWRKLSNTEK